jgi:hypothetical protein
MIYYFHPRTQVFNIFDFLLLIFQPMDRIARNINPFTDFGFKKLSGEPDDGNYLHRVGLVDLLSGKLFSNKPHFSLFKSASYQSFMFRMDLYCIVSCTTPPPVLGGDLGWL